MKRILYVDDDAYVRTTIADALTDRGFSVVQARSGQEGLEKLAEPFDLVVSDFDMPGLNGVEFLQQAGLPATTQRCIITGGDVPAIKELAQKAGLDRLPVLGKVDFQFLLDRIERLVDRPVIPSGD